MKWTWPRVGFSGSNLPHEYAVTVRNVPMARAPRPDARLAEECGRSLHALLLRHCRQFVSAQHPAGYSTIALDRFWPGVGSGVARVDALPPPAVCRRLRRWNPRPDAHHAATTSFHPVAEGRRARPGR